MKKVYVKPDIILVDFSLSSSIATICRYTGTNVDVSSCGFVENGFVVFTSPSTGCTMPAPNGAEFCYHAPTEDNSVFSS